MISNSWMKLTWVLAELQVHGFLKSKSGWVSAGVPADLGKDLEH
jgi:hypothetical protein